jgi:hypothetical protein
LFFAAVLGILLLQPRIEVSDSDAEAYLLGAQSLREGRGYVDRLGDPLNHWPPGYSMLLSLTPEPKLAALVLNYIAFGIAVVLLESLARFSGWTRVQAAALSTALGFGLLRHLAVAAKPDILSYALFLLGIHMYLRDESRWRILACFVWAALIPLKLVALVFAPGVLLSSMCRQGAAPFLKARWKECLIAGCFWLLFFGGSLLFNQVTIHAWVAASHAQPTLESLANEAIRFGTSFFRAGLACWYGSIRPLSIMIPFALVLIVGGVCLLGLRRSSRGLDLRWMGASLLALSWMLEGVQQFYADPRLMGYGMLLILVGLEPRSGTIPVWLVYAGVTIGLAVYNSLTVVRLGVNHPQYELVAKQAAQVIPHDQKVYTNTHRILDLHSAIPSQTVATLDGLPVGSWYFEATMPNYDAIARPIGFPPERDVSWIKMASFDGATLYRKGM